MQIKDINIGDLIPYEKNPRKNENAIEYVKNSIEQFGFKVPIVIDKNNVIVCGHTRYVAAKQLGFDKVPCVVADDLTEEQITAYRLADNKVAEFSDWDMSLLNEELDKLLDFDMSAFGFFDEEEEEEEQEEEIIPEVEFTEVLEEENNYIVLFFDNAIDWLQAETLFDIKSVKGLSTRKDGGGTPSKGIGRVLNGSKALSKIIDWGVKE